MHVGCSQELLSHYETLRKVLVPTIHVGCSVDTSIEAVNEYWF